MKRQSSLDWAFRVSRLAPLAMGGPTGGSLFDQYASTPEPSYRKSHRTPGGTRTSQLRSTGVKVRRAIFKSPACARAVAQLLAHTRTHRVRGA